jgi:chorismate dehydratase
MDKIRVSAVSYLNTKPFVYGLQHSDLTEKMELSLDIPSLCASKLTSGLADIGLIPVTAMADVPNAQIISNYGIAASGRVRTVVLLSHIPLMEITRIILDYQSRTSVRLVQILAKFFWKIDPDWENGEPGYIESNHQQSTAIVVIGDRVFEAVKRYPFCYDLSEIWKSFTGFDFVFACWIANKPIDISAFNRALAFGLLHIQEVIEECEKSYPDYQLNEYFYKNLSFTFDDSKRKGLELFLKLNNQIDNKIS